METSLIITFCSGILPITASIFILAGPRKYKKIIVNILFFSIGLLIGLLINHFVANNKPIEKEEYINEILEPSVMNIGDEIKFTDFIITYDNYEISTAIHYLTIKYSETIKHITFSVRGQSKRVELGPLKLIVYFIANYPLKNDAIRISISQILYK